MAPVFYKVNELSVPGTSAGVVCIPFLTQSIKQSQSLVIDIIQIEVEEADIEPRFFSPVTISVKSVPEEQKPSELLSQFTAYITVILLEDVTGEQFIELAIESVDIKLKHAI